MHLQGAIVVNESNERVWRFFREISNLAKWDRSVARVVPTSAGPYGVGSTFDTIAPARSARAGKEGLRMSYRVTEYVPNRRGAVRLTQSRMFTSAEWIMSTEDVSDGVRVTCELECSVSPRYGFLVPILLLTYRRAFRRDLMCLKQAIEQDD